MSTDDDRTALCVVSHLLFLPLSSILLFVLCAVGEEKGGMKIDFWTTGSGAGDELISPTTSVVAMGSLDLR